ncbi:MAG: glycosyltransferase family 4 protein, partial [Chromatiaceae bacterium]|nr:glycosyltransferase family 4 protein [Chromatiaceae bacterium]
RRGAVEGCDPNSFFNSAWYLEQHPSVAKKKLNPLVHYVRWGADAGFDPSSLFDSKFYLDQNPDVASSAVNALVHYLEVGREQGRPCCLPQRKLPVQGRPRFDDTALHDSLRLQLPPEWALDWKTFISLCPNPKRILLVGWRSPAPDTRSTSFRIRQFAECYSEAGFAVDHIVDEEIDKSGCAYTEIDHEQQMILGLNASVRHLSRHGMEYKLVLLFGRAIFERYASIVRAFAVDAKVVYDSGNTHYVRFSHAAKVPANDAVLGVQAPPSMRLELANARSADSILVIAEGEKNTLLEEEPSLDVRIVPNIQEVVDEVSPFSIRRDLFFFGCFDDDRDAEAVHYFASRILPLVSEKLPQIRFRIVGSNIPADIRGLASANVEPVGDVDDLEPFFQQSRIFVAPFCHDSGMTGRVSTSLSFGLPVVTTSMGTEGMALIDGENALICDDAEAFAAGIIRLYGSEDLWVHLSDEGRALIRRSYSVSVVHDQLLSLAEP